MLKLKEEMDKGDLLLRRNESVIRMYIEILNHSDSLILVQSLNRELANIKFDPSIQELQLDDHHLLTLSHLQRELYLMIRYI